MIVLTVLVCVMCSSVCSLVLLYRRCPIKGSNKCPLTKSTRNSDAHKRWNNSCLPVTMTQQTMYSSGLVMSPEDNGLSSPGTEESPEGERQELKPTFLLLCPTILRSNMFHCLWAKNSGTNMLSSYLLNSILESGKNYLRYLPQGIISPEIYLCKSTVKTCLSRLTSCSLILSSRPSPLCAHLSKAILI